MYVNLVGKKYHRLTVISHNEEMSYPRKPYWNCLCDCGNEKIVSGNNLKTGQVKSCGCLASEMLIKRNTTHGEADNSPFYALWKRIKGRCYNKNSSDYIYYGARGITLFSAWIDNYVAFKEYIEKLPKGENQNSLDRIENNGNYEPGNVRWATQTEQLRNYRRNRYVETLQGKMLMSDAAKIAGVSNSTMFQRLKSGWPMEKLLQRHWTD